LQEGLTERKSGQEWGHFVFLLFAIEPPEFLLSTFSFVESDTLYLGFLYCMFCEDFI
jgi:hypothetical protein